jgi:tetratricopeptide (TPR) repeat protein
MRLRRSVVSGVLVLVLGAGAGATPRAKRSGASARAEAEAHFIAANRAFHAARWDEAIVELQAAYELQPRPELLISMAQTFREMGRFDEAITRCERYLAVAPDGALAPQVQKLARDLRREMQRTPPPPPPTQSDQTEEADDEPPSSAASDDEPPSNAPPAREPVAKPPAPARPASIALSETDAPHQAAPAIDRKKLTWALVTSAVIVVVGVGLGVGIGVGTRAPPAPPTRLGTVPFE